MDWATQPSNFKSHKNTCRFHQVVGRDLPRAPSGLRHRRWNEVKVGWVSISQPTDTWSPGHQGRLYKAARSSMHVYSVHTQTIRSSRKVASTTHRSVNAQRSQIKESYRKRSTGNDQESAERPAPPANTRQNLKSSPGAKKGRAPTSAP